MWKETYFMTLTFDYMIVFTLSIVMWPRPNSRLWNLRCCCNDAYYECSICLIILIRRHFSRMPNCPLSNSPCFIVNKFECSWGWVGWGGAGHCRVIPPPPVDRMTHWQDRHDCITLLSAISLARGNSGKIKWKYDIYEYGLTIGNSAMYFDV